MSEAISGMSKLIGTRHVLLNGLWLPANLAAQQVRRACVSLHANTGNLDWPSSNLGSAFLYRYRGRQFCVFSRHQISGDWRPEQLCVHLANDRSRLFSGGRLVQFLPSVEQREEHDLCAMEMPWRLQAEHYSPMWFEATGDEPSSIAGGDPMFCVGYPSKLNQIDGDEKCTGVHLSQVLVWGESFGGDNGGLPSLALEAGAVMVPKCEGDFDGFSGSPVFGINLRRHGLEFRGIVIRGGHPRLFFIPASWVNRLCDYAFDDPPLMLSAA